MGDRWWVIHEDTIIDALRRCADGEDPDIMLIELTANSELGGTDTEEG